MFMPSAKWRRKTARSRGYSSRNASSRARSNARAYASLKCWSFSPSGPERVVVGSDYPFDMGEADPAGFLAGAGLDAAVRTGIEHGNAVRFLGLA